MRPDLVLLLGATLWGLGWLPLAGFAARGFAGMPVVACTYGLLSLLALPVVIAQRAAWRAQWRALAAIGLCGGWATAGLVAALSEGDVVRAMLLFYLAPAWSLLGGWLLLGERLSAARLGTLALALAGIALTLGVDREAFRTFAVSDALALSAGLAFAINNLATRAAERTPLASKTLVAFLGSFLLGTAFCLLRGESPLPPDAALWPAIALFGVFWLIAMGAAQYGFSHLEASRAAVLVVVELLVAVLSAGWLGDRPLGLREWLGSALVLAAALAAALIPSLPVPIVLREAES